MWYDDIKKGLETGLKDIDGKEIFTGDIVEFYFCMHEGFSSKPEGDNTRMVDIVSIEDDGETYFRCSFGRCLASRAVEYCRVIGTDPSLIEL